MAVIFNIKNNSGVYFGLLFLISCILIVSCIEPFEPNYNLQNKILVVEGSISDGNGDQYVSFKEAIPNGSTSSFFKSVKGAIVNIVVNDTEKIAFDETEPGYFIGPLGFKGEAGKSYRLEMTTAEGERFETLNQVLRATPPILKVYQKTVLEGIDLGRTTIPATYIYIDTQDPAGVGDNYLWTWRNFERQGICVSCFGGRWFENPRPEGKCVDDPALKESSTTYDYGCDEPCWDIYHSNEILAQSDFLSDGLTITAKKVAEIPFYNAFGGLIEITQQSVSEEAYKYLKLLIDQGQNTGGLADTPPAALVGNVFNVSDPSLAVGGYFLVASATQMTYWIDRSDVANLNLNTFGLLKGRSTNLEPSVDLRPPLSPCLNSRNRTNTKPEGFLTF